MFYHWSAFLWECHLALNVRCGSCFHAVWNQEREKAGLFMEMTEDTSGAINVGIEAMKRIIAADLEKQNQQQDMEIIWFKKKFFNKA